MDSPDAQRDTAAQTAPDRRVYPRHNVQVPIEIHEEGHDVPMRLATTDLSGNGCYIELMMPFAIGADIHVTLWLDDTSIVIQGRVVTHHPQFGNGITFEKFAGEGEQLLQRFLDGIET